MQFYKNLRKCTIKSKLGFSTFGVDNRNYSAHFKTWFYGFTKCFWPISFWQSDTANQHTYSCNTCSMGQNECPTNAGPLQCRLWNGVWEQTSKTEFIRKIVTNEVPFKHNSQTAPAFIISDERNFDAEKKRLIDYVSKTLQMGEQYFDNKESMSFGKLSATEWNNMFYKHLNHHLTQFGVWYSTW